MKNRLFKPCLGMLLALVLTTVAAQHGLVTTGGEATGTTGQVSFSVGQVFCNIQTGMDGTAVQGLQQPFEISVVTSMQEAEEMQLLVSAYPNPATDILTLRIDGIALEHIPLLDISLFDINGKQMMSKQAEGLETSIAMTYMPPGIYFLQIIDPGMGIGGSAIKTFKIIKKQ